VNVHLAHRQATLLHNASHALWDLLRQLTKDVSRVGLINRQTKIELNASHVHSVMFHWTEALAIHVRLVKNHQLSTMEPAHHAD